METEYTLWLWQNLTNDLQDHGTDAKVLHGIINSAHGINKHSRKDYTNEQRSTDGNN